MGQESQSYNLGALRELLIQAFTTDELRALVSYDDRLRGLVREFAPTDPIAVMVDKAIAWCDRRGVIGYLVDRVREERPDKLRKFEGNLYRDDAPSPARDEAPLSEWDGGEPELFVGEPWRLREEETISPGPETLTITSPIYLDLVRVPAGPFLMGSVAARDQHAQDDELPPHHVHTSEFYVGQYPVTNLQYQAFIRASEHEAPQYWDAGEVPGARENHPAVWISWEDAVAFCAWLSDEAGQVFRLPTEAEWEKAARGTDGLIYPWGDEPPDESRCSFGGKIGDTTPIGLYSPQGDSPYGCADMLGNAWEWCQSLYKSYPYRVGDGREDTEAEGVRVLRGGAFYYIQRNVRCAYRNRILPHDAYRSFGFRVVAPNPVT